MRKKIITILTLLCAVSLCLGLTACKKTNMLDDYYAKGYRIFVTYDAVSGEFARDPDLSIIDAFKPSAYEKDAEGKIHIKLKEPDLKERWGVKDMSLTFSEHSFVGWYKNATMKTDASGNPLGENGERIYLYEGVYYAEEAHKTIAYPAYEYSEPWNFETDEIVYSEDQGKLEMTLYCGWVRYYTFDYYYKYDTDGEDVAWQKYGTTTFNYVYNTRNGGNKDQAFLPDWGNGAMQYTSKYSDNTNFNFPKLANSTFKEAYSDEACENKIEGSITHGGSLDEATCSEVNRTTNVYVIFEKGDRYRIETAQQLSQNGNSAGIYTILADLDFSGIAWPAAFVNGKFTGTFDGNGKTIKNVTAVRSSGTSAYSGTFANVAKGAVVKNVVFENLTFDTGNAAVDRLITSVYFGTFAGYIEDGSTVENVTVKNATFKLGAVAMTSVRNKNLNLFVNDERKEKTGLTLEGTPHFTIYAHATQTQYFYTVKLEINDTTGELTSTDGLVDGNKITATFISQKRYEIKDGGIKASYDIQ